MNSDFGRCTFDFGVIKTRLIYLHGAFAEFQHRLQPVKNTIGVVLRKNKVALKAGGAKKSVELGNFGVMTLDATGTFFINATWCCGRHQNPAKETPVPGVTIQLCGVITQTQWCCDTKVARTRFQMP